MLGESDLFFAEDMAPRVSFAITTRKSIASTECRPANEIHSQKSRPTDGHATLVF
jgi:hypothetical protein